MVRYPLENQSALSAKLMCNASSSLQTLCILDPVDPASQNIAAVMTWSVVLAGGEQNLL